MKIEITKDARTKLKDTLKESDFEQPALRIIFAGMG